MTRLSGLAARITVPAALSLAILCAPAVVTAAPVFPTPNPPINSLQFGDLTVYSLPFLTFRTGTNFNVQSSPGHISSHVVALTGASGNPVNRNFAGMDDGYPS